MARNLEAHKAQRYLRLEGVERVYFGKLCKHSPGEIITGF